MKRRRKQLNFKGWNVAKNIWNLSFSHTPVAVTAKTKADNGDELALRNDYKFSEV